MKTYIAIYLAISIMCSCAERTDYFMTIDTSIDSVENDSADLSDSISDSEADSTEDSNAETDVVDTSTDTTVDEEADSSTAVCGNSIVEAWDEECDDGDLNDCNGCSATCAREYAIRVDNGVAAGRSTPGPCLTGDMTVEAWFKSTDTVLRSAFLVSQEWGYRLAIAEPYSGFTFSIIVSPTSQAPIGWTVPITKNEWHHVAVTVHRAFDHWGFDGFLDGVHIGTRDTTWTGDTVWWMCDGNMYIGGYGIAGSPWHYPYTGMVDEIRISDGRIYSGNFTPASRLSVISSTLAYWSFNDDLTSGIVPDVSGHSYDLDVSGGVSMPDECHTP